MTVPAYQRQGCNQSGNRLIVWPQTRHKKRRTQTVIQPVSTSPRTCRQYRPCPTTSRTPAALRADWPQNTQAWGRKSSRQGASALRAQSCSTCRARLCRMINSWLVGGCFRRNPAKRGLIHRPSSFPQRTILIDHRGNQQVRCLAIALYGRVMSAWILPFP